MRPYRATLEEDGFSYHRSLLASIDFTFTGHRTERNSSFASQGGWQARDLTTRQLAPRALNFRHHALAAFPSARGITRRR